MLHVKRDARHVVTGCGGDESLSLQWREGGAIAQGSEVGWRAWRGGDGSQRLVGSKATLTGLLPHRAFQVRCLAHNGLGSSSPGAAATTRIASPKLR